MLGIGLGENVGTDGILLETVRGSRQRFLSQVGQKIAMDFGGAQRLALDNPLDLRKCGFLLEDHCAIDDITAMLKSLVGLALHLVGDRPLNDQFLATEMVTPIWLDVLPTGRITG